MFSIDSKKFFITLKTTQMKTLIENVKRWGHEKGILGLDGKGTLQGQSKKMIEEANETLVAVSQYSTFSDLPTLGGEFEKIMKDEHQRLYTECCDGIGDTLVTLILLSEMLNTDIMTCLQLAYETISERKGQMVNGVFVKEN